MLGQDTVVFLLYDWPYSLWPITREHQEEKRLRLFKPRFDAKECKWRIINKLLKKKKKNIWIHSHSSFLKEKWKGREKWVLGHICLTFRGPLVPYPYFMWCPAKSAVKHTEVNIHFLSFFAVVCMEHPQLSNISWVSFCSNLCHSFQSTATNCFWPTKNTRMIRVGILTSKRSIFSAVCTASALAF